MSIYGQNYGYGSFARHVKILPHNEQSGGFPASSATIFTGAFPGGYFLLNGDVINIPAAQAPLLKTWYDGLKDKSKPFVNVTGIIYCDCEMTEVGGTYADPALTTSPRKTLRMTEYLSRQLNDTTAVRGHFVMTMFPADTSKNSDYTRWHIGVYGVIEGNARLIVATTNYQENKQSKSVAAVSPVLVNYADDGRPIELGSTDPGIGVLAVDFINIAAGTTDSGAAGAKKPGN